MDSFSSTAVGLRIDDQSASTAAKAQAQQPRRASVRNVPGWSVIGIEGRRVNG